MKKKLVSYTMETLPLPTDADRARLAEVFRRPENEIDMSDLPEMTGEQQSKGKAVRGLFYRPVPKVETLAAMKTEDERKVSTTANIREMIAQLHAND